MRITDAHTSSHKVFTQGIHKVGMKFKNRPVQTSFSTSFHFSYRRLAGDSQDVSEAD